MATAKLAVYPKKVRDELAKFAGDYRIDEQVLLSAIVLFALDNQKKFDSKRNVDGIDIHKDIQDELINFPVGPIEEKNKIKKWGTDSGRNYDLQILFIITRFFELKYKSIPQLYLGKAAVLKMNIKK